MLDATLAGREVYTIIWTTTPWTLPASLAVAFHPDFDYVALESTEPSRAPSLRLPSGARVGDHESPIYIVAAELAPQVIAACNLGETKELARFKGRVLERSQFQHPFLNRTILGVLAQYGHRRRRHRRSPHRSLARRGRLLHRPALRPRPHLPSGRKWTNRYRFRVYGMISNLVRLLS